MTTHKEEFIKIVIPTKTKNKKSFEGKLTLNNLTISKIVSEDDLTNIYFEGRNSAYWCETSNYIRKLNVKDKVNITFDVCKTNQCWIRTMTRKSIHHSYGI